MNASTAVVEVAGLVSSLSAEGVRRMLERQTGVRRADVNYVAGSATVHYDATRTSPGALRDAVVACGYHCRGELVPNHVCAAAPAPPAKAHAHHEAAHGGHSPAPAAARDAMHDMGHAPGMSMDAMVRDMRNRFLVALAFAIPVFLYSPMGAMLGPLPVPFGLPRNVFLFVVATAAILYPGWPFFVAAWRAARNGVLNMATLVVLSVGTGYLFSVGATFFFAGEVFYEASAVLLVFILLGHWLEMRARAGASDAIRALMDLAPPKATVIRDGREVEVATAEVAVAFASPARIDRDNILRASLWALAQAVAALPCRPKLVYVDGRDRIAVPCDCQAVISGDALVLSIAAASIVAKVTRDRLMREIGAAHPGYGFERHMGYSVPEHQEALKRLGPTIHHRQSFSPVAVAAGRIPLPVAEDSALPL